ncbi:Putative protein [Zobellia galactanivorans]|uniref:Uncharacterized protein n=1 Tax=Zobellia galactanivorans (strain DSM 12802 / CCUG 47099 / CIP 106680 / NCIMB 13871 / Dsij) TaxID=63186 RepID=G0L2C0_ZOBGA|nr:Putative protein [Zobellia galactanivorans]
MFIGDGNIGHGEGRNLFDIGRPKLKGRAVEDFKGLKKRLGHVVDI